MAPALAFLRATEAARAGLDPPDGRSSTLEEHSVAGAVCVDLWPPVWFPVSDAPNAAS
jgi:hypothetical protein